jgi:hypothetical protein
VSFFAPAFLVWEKLRINEVVPKFAVETGVEPIHHFIDLRSLLEVSWRHLARSHEFVESLERFLLDSEKLKNAKQPEPSPGK